LRHLIAGPIVRASNSLAPVERPPDPGALFVGPWVLLTVGRVQEA